MQATTPKDSTKYNPSSIQLKEGMEHVRARPAMYIGDIYERGLHHLVNEVVDNSVDEHMAGFCSEIDVTIHEDGAITILDNGRGIPIGIHAKAGLPTLEVCLTRLGAGGKFDKDSYQVSGGLHGVGVSCVNALAEWLEAEVYRDGQGHKMRFERGQTVRKLEELGPSTKTGTKISFLPDIEIFKNGIEFKYDRIAERLKELAYLNAGLKVVMRDERGDEPVEDAYCFPEGLAAFAEELARSENTLLDKPIYLKGSRPSESSGGRVEVEIAVQYNDTYTDTVVSYTNNINTREGGTHLTGFRTALTSTLNNWLKEPDNRKKLRVKENERPSGDDYREGLVAVVSVKVPEPQFEGQTKTKLGNSDVAGIVQSVLGEYLKNWCEQNFAETKRVVEKALQARKGRIAAKKAKDLVRKAKDALRGGGVAKLVDCNSRNRHECELYLVEGDSAGGTAVTARDNNIQAILPLRGKILNVWKATKDKILNNNEISTMIKVLGTGALDDFDISKLQYNKIVIMCDADVDGSHIRTLILTFFFRQMPELIENGHVYVAQPPLFKVTEKGKSEKKREETARYFLTVREFDLALLEMGQQGGSFARAGGESLASGESLMALTKLALRVNKAAEEVNKKVPLRKYLARGRDGLLPYAKISAGGKKAPAVYTEDELNEWLKTAREAQPDLTVWRHTDPISEREGADVEITTFTSKARLETMQKTLMELGFTWDDFFRPEVPRGEPEPPARFVINKGKHEVEVRGLCDLPGALKELAQKAWDVQRYKGLGEMDWEELKETTMAPSKRRLLKITMEDVASVNQIFGKLMGSKVEPRRDFIQRHALNVRDIDA